MSVYEVETEDGSVYEVETQDPYSGPTLASDPVGALTSADWWLTRPSGERISAGQAVAGPAASALQGLTLGGGDELVAGLSSLLPGETYDNALAKMRGVQQNFAEASPVADVALQLSGALKTPVPAGIFSKGKGVVTAGKNIGKGAALGAGYGGASGFLSGEGEDRIAGAGQGAAIGGVVGGGLQAVAETLSGLASRAPEFARSQNRKSIGTRQGDYSKSPQTVELPLTDGDTEIASKVKTTLDDLLDNGYLGNSRKPQDLMKMVAIREKELATDVGRLIRDADKKVVPDWGETIKFLESGRGGEKTELFSEKLSKLDDLIQTRGKGQLSYLQQQKVAKGTEWNPNDSLVNEFNRALYADMQRAIEEAQSLVKPLNAELGKLKTVKPIIKRGLDAAENRDLGNRIIDFTKTTGGVGVPLVLGGILGDKEGAIAGGTLGLGIKGMTTPAGRKLIADAARKLGPMLGKAAEKLTGAIRGVAGVSGLETPKQPSESTNTQQERQQPSVSQKVGSSSKSAPNSLFSQTESRLFGKNNRSVFGKGEKMSSKINLDRLKPEVKSLLEKAEPEMQALVMQESSGNPNAVSKAGAKGLTQLMDATGREWHDILGLPGEYNPFNAEQNLKIGTAYYKWLKKQFGGDAELALTAYNQGIGNVQKALAASQGTSLADIIDGLGPDGQKYASGVLSKMKGVA